jgi:protein-S-isoprenylcysteine O-methyltransferase Ste14
MKIEDDSPRVRFPPPFVFLGTLIGGIAVDRLAGGPWLGLPYAVRIPLGAALTIAGLAVIVIAARLFRKVDTNIEPWRPSTSIVSSGPYGWSRNPIYLAMATAYCGLAVAFDSLVALAMLPIVLIVIQTQVIAREEKYLEAKFGDAYRAYQRRVRRWL